ncbi:protein YgfX [Acidihalobacter prosperus]
MSSPRSVEPLYLQPKPSRQLAGFFVLLHVTAAAALPYLGLPAWGLTFLGLLLAWSLYRNLRLYVLLGSPRSILRLVWEVSGNWRIWDGLGQEHTARLAPDCFVRHRIIVLSLHLLDGGGRRTIVLLQDSLDNDILRRLYLRLRREHLNQHDNRDD